MTPSGSGRGYLAVFEDADRTRNCVEQGALNFVIVGGGPTGTEMAGALADMITNALAAEYTDLAVKHARVYIVDHGHALLGSFSAEGPRRMPPRSAPAKGRAIPAGRAREGNRSRSCFAFRRRLDPDAHSGLGRGTDGFVAGIRRRIAARAWRTNRGAIRPHGRRDFPGVYVLGDFANVPGPDGQPLPQLGSVAQQCGEYTATNILAEIAGKSGPPFH